MVIATSIAFRFKMDLKFKVTLLIVAKQNIIQPILSYLEENRRTIISSLKCCCWWCPWRWFLKKSVSWRSYELSVGDLGRNYQYQSHHVEVMSMFDHLVEKDIGENTA